MSDDNMHDVARRMAMSAIYAWMQNLYKDRIDYDRMTGLHRADRGYHFLKGALMESAERGRFPVSVVMTDGNNFKPVNDNLGHPVGDEFISGLAASTMYSIRPGDGLFRYGGDEFMLVLPGADKDEAEIIMQRVLKGVESYKENEFRPAAQRLLNTGMLSDAQNKAIRNAGMSYGIATYDPHQGMGSVQVGAYAQQMVVDADIIMLAQKRARGIKR